MNSDRSAFIIPGSARAFISSSQLYGSVLTQRHGYSPSNVWMCVQSLSDACVKDVTDRQCVRVASVTEGTVDVDVCV